MNKMDFCAFKGLSVAPASFHHQNTVDLLIFFLKCSYVSGVYFCKWMCGYLPYRSLKKTSMNVANYMKFHWILMC